MVSASAAASGTVGQGRLHFSSQEQSTLLAASLNCPLYVRHNMHAIPTNPTQHAQYECQVHKPQYVSTGNCGPDGTFVASSFHRVIRALHLHPVRSQSKWFQHALGRFLETIRPTRMTSASVTASSWYDTLPSIWYPMTSTWGANCHL